METQKIYTELRLIENQNNLNKSFYNDLKTIMYLNQDNLNDDDKNKLVTEYLQTQNTISQLNIYIDDLKKKLNKSYSIKSFQISNLSTYKKVFYDKPFNSFDLISNVSTIKETDIKYILKFLYKKGCIHYGEYKNALYRYNHRQQIKEDNNNKRVLRTILYRNKEYLKGQKINIYNEFMTIQYKKIFTDKIQNFINSYFKTIKSQSGKNTQSHLKKLDNKRYIHITRIHGQNFHFRTKKEYTLLIEDAYKKHSLIMLKSLLNNTLLNKEGKRKYINDTTIINY